MLQILQEKHNNCDGKKGNFMSLMAVLGHVDGFL